MKSITLLATMSLPLASVADARKVGDAALGESRINPPSPGGPGARDGGPATLEEAMAVKMAKTGSRDSVVTASWGQDVEPAPSALIAVQGRATASRPRPTRASSRHRAAWPPVGSPVPPQPADHAGSGGRARAAFLEAPSEIDTACDGSLPRGQRKTPKDSLIPGVATGGTDPSQALPMMPTAGPRHPSGLNSSHAVSTTCTA